MIASKIAEIRSTLPSDVTLVCVSKFHPIAAIREAYEVGERDFGESRVQELLLKQKELPNDIRWHFIGHLQTNKVKQIIPFVYLIHSVDSLHLLEVISDEAVKAGRVVNVLLEVHVAAEASKTGFSPDDAASLQAIVDLNHAPTFLREYPGVNIVGLMSMATNTDNVSRIRQDFAQAADLYREIFPNKVAVRPAEPISPDSLLATPSSHALPAHGGVLSIGMSEDFPLAIQAGSNMIRIGSLIFGERK